MKNIKIYIILLVLIIIAGIYYFSNSKGSLNLRNTSFSNESTEDITKIQISSPESRVELTKESDNWKVNNKYWATEKYIENLLLATQRVVISSPVSKAEKQQIVSILKADGILVEFYKKNRSIKKFYVSKPSMNPSKTYMMMEKSDEPFIVKIPAFKGLLAQLFVIDENYWRNKTVFDYQPQNIENIAVNYSKNKEKSFRIINYNNGTFALQNLSNESFEKDFNVDKVARYFTYFQRITFEDVVQDLNQEKIDSVLESLPYCEIEVEDITGGKNKIAIYRKPSKRELDEFGNKVLFDYDRAYASFNNNHELITIQYYIFDPLFKEIDYFR